MPNVVSHYLFSQDLYERVHKDSFLEGNFDYLALGAQGPDTLFFSGHAPWDYHPKMAKEDYGNKLHDENGEKYIQKLCERLHSIKDKKEYNRFASFIFGSFTHIALDQITHPFTYYFTGFDEGHLVRHSMIESAYGANQAASYGRKDLIRNPLPALPYIKEEYRLIDKNLRPVLEEIFKVKFYKKQYQHALRTYRFVLKFINSPLGSKMARGQIRALRMDDNPSRRCLNLDHKEWKVPYSGEVKTDSFLDLFNQAMDKCLKLFVDLQIKGFHEETFKPYFNDFNYEGFPVGGKMIYCSPDYERTDW